MVHFSFDNLLNCEITANWLVDMGGGGGGGGAHGYLSLKSEIRAVIGFYTFICSKGNFLTQNHN